ncbi:MoxR-like ATPase [Paucibacter oligotrophus]|uniref:MoxR-like ATPase n=1 Tax=Roseateles oligotrophus TaxID=1769250 RepID=A0A840LA48_9BURK|nr:phage protein Gp27 family protein [Roseateles oligotrophus]MBB4844996.1 MoxR-like ATPase [Roseateles oligotrophus]
MGRKSTISRLPLEQKAFIEGRLAEGRCTLDELIAQLRERWPAADQAGELPSRTAVHRYGQKLERRLAAIRASTEAAKIIQAQAGDDKDARSEALTALVQTELFEAILALQEADDPKADPSDRVSMLSAAAKNIATLTRSSVNLKQFQAKVEEDTRKRLLEEQRAKLDALGSKGGVTEDTKRAIREALGIV